jgi:hypothetical protein
MKTTSSGQREAPDDRGDLRMGEPFPFGQQQKLTIVRSETLKGVVHPTLLFVRRARLSPSCCSFVRKPIGQGNATLATPPALRNDVRPVPL